MDVRQSIRLTPLLKDMTGIEIRDAAEYAIANGWKPGEPLGLLVDNVLKCIPNLQIIHGGEYYDCWVAPCKEFDYKYAVCVGCPEDYDAIGTLADMVDYLRVPRYF